LRAARIEVEASRAQLRRARIERRRARIEYHRARSEFRRTRIGLRATPHDLESMQRMFEATQHESHAIRVGSAGTRPATAERFPNLGSILLGVRFVPRELPLTRPEFLASLNVFEWTDTALVHSQNRPGVVHLS
jgi:hypothetical protein